MRPSVEVQAWLVATWLVQVWPIASRALSSMRLTLADAWSPIRIGFRPSTDHVLASGDHHNEGVVGAVSDPHPCAVTGTEAATTKPPAKAVTPSTRMPLVAAVAMSTVFHVTPSVDTQMSDE